MTEKNEIMPMQQVGGGGMLVPQSFGEVMEFAQIMAKASIGLPKHLRNDHGACLAVAMFALRQEMDPFAVASKSYSVNGVIAYEAQLLAAVINTRAGLKGRLDYEYDGEGETLTCKVTGVFRNGDERTYESPPMGSITPKNSPLWKTDPEQQLGYYSARAWARRYAPETILGVYDRDEAEMIDVTPTVVGDIVADEEGEVTPYEEITPDAPVETADDAAAENTGDVPETVEPEPDIVDVQDDGSTEESEPEPEPEPTPEAEDVEDVGADSEPDEPGDPETPKVALAFVRSLLERTTTSKEAVEVFNSGGAKELAKKFGGNTSILIKALVATYRDFNAEKLDDEQLSERLKTIPNIDPEQDEKDVLKELAKVGISL